MDEKRSGSDKDSCLKALHSFVTYGHDSLTSLAPRCLKKMMFQKAGASSGQGQMLEMEFFHVHPHGRK